MPGVRGEGCFLPLHYHYITSTFLPLIFYFDSTIKSSEDVEKKLGVVVIGSIPMAGGKRG